MAVVQKCSQGLTRRISLNVTPINGPEIRADIRSIGTGESADGVDLVRSLKGVEAGDC